MVTAMWCIVQCCSSLRRRTPDLQPTTTLDNTPHCCNHSLTLMKMGKRLSETCWADSKINKIVIVASSWSFTLFTYTDDARSKVKTVIGIRTEKVRVQG